MANNISDFLAVALLNHCFRNTPYSQPAIVYVGLVDNVGSDAEMKAGTLTHEITTYTGNRPAVTFGAPAPVGNTQTIKNTGAVDFLVMPAVTVKYAIVMDSATKGAGNILYWCPLTTPKTCNAGDTFELPINNLVLDLD